MHRPYVLVYVTETVDGRIASRTGFSRLSCPYDLKRLHWFRAWCDAIIVGAGTVIKDDPLLTVRYVKGRNPVRVVVDGRLRIPLNARIITDKSAKTIIFTSKYADNEKISELRDKGVEVYVVGETPKLSIRKVLELLYSIGIRRVLVEGGGELLWSFFSEGVVDEVRVTIAPYIFGGRNAVSMVMGVGFKDTDEAFKLKLKEVSICKCGNEVHIVWVRA